MLRLFKRKPKIRTSPKGAYILDCPNCGDFITMNYVFESIKYCGWCGQRINYAGIRAAIDKLMEEVK